MISLNYQRTTIESTKTKKRTWILDAEKKEIEASTSTPKMGTQTNLECDKTSTIFSISKSAFQRFSRIGKRPPSAQDMAKKLTATPKMHLSEKLQTLA